MASRPGDEPPEFDEVRAFYDEEYYLSSGAATGVPWHVRRIADRLGDLDGRRVLDVACGEGQWLAELVRRGAVPAGIDISSRAIARCRELLPGADIREGVAERLPFDDRQFDVVTCLGSLEHFLDQAQALSEIRRVSREGATILILVPNSDFLTRRLGWYKGTGQTAIRETVRPLAEWADMFNQAGLQVLTRWRDLRPVSIAWLCQGQLIARPLRLLQALALLVWPVSWQYQVYFLCKARSVGP